MKYQSVVLGLLGAAAIAAMSATIAVSMQVGAASPVLSTVRVVNTSTQAIPIKAPNSIPVVVQGGIRGPTRRGSEQFQVVGVCLTGSAQGYLTLNDLNGLGARGWHAVGSVGSFTSGSCGVGFNLLLERDV